MAAEVSGPAFEIHGGGLDLVFPHHENEVAQSSPSATVCGRSGRTTGCCASPARRCRSRVGEVTTIRETIDRWGPEAAPGLLPHRVLAKPIDFSPETMEQAVAGATPSGTRSPASLRRHDESGTGQRFTAALEDDFDTPAALARDARGGPRRELELLRRGLAVFGLGGSPSVEAPPDVVALAERRAEARAARDFETSDRLRDELAALGLGDARPGRRLRPRAGVTPDLVYGRRAVREALRGRREVLEIWATERAVKAEDWLAEARPKQKLERELSERAETRDHQGVLALVAPFRYADAYELPLLRSRCWSCSTGSPTRATSVRSAGSAEGAGATGVIVPAHGSAVVTPAVARASAGAVEHLPIAVVTNLARYLEEVKGADLWVFGATGDASAVDVGDGPVRRRRARARRRGHRAAAAGQAHLRRARLDPARAARSSRSM